MARAMAAAMNTMSSNSGTCAIESAAKRRVGPRSIGDPFRKARRHRMNMIIGYISSTSTSRKRPILPMNQWLVT